MKLKMYKVFILAYNERAFRTYFASELLSSWPNKKQMDSLHVFDNVVSPHGEARDASRLSQVWLGFS